MLLYIVVLWGNDASPDGANGEDTIYFIRAASMLKAVEIAEFELRNLPHERCVPEASVCVELGQDLEENLDAKVIIGPLIKFFYMTDILRTWIRNFHSSDWEEAPLTL